MSYVVYQMSSPDLSESYFGSTSNFSKRKSLHKRRFEGRTTGSNCYVYEVLRKHTKNFSDCHIEVIRTFKDSYEAKLYEQKMIAKYSTLNSYNAVSGR